jgi:hypothetical protein
MRMTKKLLCGKAFDSFLNLRVFGLGCLRIPRLDWSLEISYLEDDISHVQRILVKGSSLPPFSFFKEISGR